MTARRGRRAAALAALALAGAAACSGGGDDGDGDRDGDGSGDGDGDAGGGSPTTTAPSEAAELVALLDCTGVSEPSAGGYEGWIVRDVRDCENHGWSDVSARVYASLTPEERDAAVRLLAMEGEPGPPDGFCGPGPVGTAIVAGDTWVAVVPGDSAVVVERLGGEVHANRISPPVSAPGIECFPP